MSCDLLDWVFFVLIGRCIIWRPVKRQVGYDEDPHLSKQLRDFRRGDEVTLPPENVSSCVVACRRVCEDLLQMSFFEV